MFSTVKGNYVLALAVCGPALYWRFKNTLNLRNSKLSCPPRVCDCPPFLSLLQIAPGLTNLSILDCGSDNPDLKQEMEKQFVDLLTEELKLQEAVAGEHARHMNITLEELKLVASQYQREADKCVAVTETCEKARERSEGLLTRERRLTVVGMPSSPSGMQANSSSLQQIQFHRQRSKHHVECSQRTSLSEV